MKNGILALFIISCYPVSAQPLNDNPLKSNMDSLVQTAAAVFFKDSVHVGLSMAIYDNGKTGFYNYGVTDKFEKRRPDKHSLYEIASLTKTFTGALLAKAVLDGKMKLDEDIRQYLKEPYPNLEYRGIPITARQLIIHRSGLQNSLPDNSEFFKSPDFDSLPFQLIRLEKDYDRKRYLKELHQIKLDTLPGSVFFKYSNIGLKLLSFALENVYQSSYDKLMATYITKPLNMNNTSLALSKRDSGKLVRGYGPSGKLTPYGLDNAGAAGGLKSSTADMINYLIWQLDENQPLVKQSHSILDGAMENYARGMGWNMANTKEGYRKVWQSGGTFGMSSQMILFPDLKIGFILLANASGFNTQGGLEKIALSILAGSR